MMPGAIGMVIVPPALVVVAVTTNCFGRPREALVSGSTSFTPVMVMMSPALRVSRPAFQPFVASENVATKALPAPAFDWPAPLTAGLVVALKGPMTGVGSFVVRKLT